ncbi:MAG: hydroxymethylglutaryl-CoA reductase (NADPH) [Methanohalobium sp.]|uniref:hydroxymethylglutaryl-CoA reductase (NADPH) n=1 Tax=Methanohalobium sp. TaxID=2837493 RepID=UPI00397BCFAC
MEPESEIKMDEDELFEKITSGEVSLRKIEKYTDANSAVKLRRKAIEKTSNVSFEYIQNHNIDAEKVTKKNIENMIGAVQIPLGIAGPLKVKGEYADGDYYVPLATTEGALVASVNRGCSVITRSNGADVRIFQDVMTRAPAFKVENVVRAQEFVEWIKKPETLKHMQDKISEITSHGELIDIDPYVLGNTVYLRFSYDTKDAMGMNMVTIATNTLVDLIEDEFGADPISLSGNMCTDKKPAALNSIQGRGKTVVAEIEIPKKVVEDRLKSTPEEMADVNYRKNLLGSARAGSLGYNAHAANVIVATNIACGQDPAHVVEGSNVITTMEVTKYGDLYCSVTLPSLLVGTVGGGTGIGTQKDCLNLLGVAGSGHPPGANAKKMAEILASAVLAGEISLIGAQAAGHLARAHAELGRGSF